MSEKIEKVLKVIGIVKWYSKSSNYGFITHENIDYYFNGNDLKGFEVNKGDEVLFRPLESSNKFKAKNIEISKKAIIESDLICCPNCKMNITIEPRTITIDNKYIKTIKKVNVSYFCPKCDFLIHSGETSDDTINVIANVIISIICIFLLYEIIMI